jgi:hypothetical protein
MRTTNLNLKPFFNVLADDLARVAKRGSLPWEQWPSGAGMPNGYMSTSSASEWRLFNAFLKIHYSKGVHGIDLSHSNTWIQTGHLNTNSLHRASILCASNEVYHQAYALDFNDKKQLIVDSHTHSKHILHPNAKQNIDSLSPALSDDDISCYLFNAINKAGYSVKHSARSEAYVHASEKTICMLPESKYSSKPDYHACMTTMLGVALKREGMFNISDLSLKRVPTADRFPMSQYYATATTQMFVAYNSFKLRLPQYPHKDLSSNDGYSSDLASSLIKDNLVEILTGSRHAQEVSLSLESSKSFTLPPNVIDYHKNNIIERERQNKTLASNLNNQEPNLSHVENGRV